MGALRVIVIGCLSVAALFAQPLTDVVGVEHGALDDNSRKATVLFFVMTDCPISNQFSPEINRICDAYEPQGVGCFLTYVDPEKSSDEIQAHASEYGHSRPALHDRDRALTAKAEATITPEAAVFSPHGELLYRGRINNLYAALGKSRQRASVHDLRRALDEIVAGKEVSIPRTQAIGCFMPPKEL